MLAVLTAVSEFKLSTASRELSCKPVLEVALGRVRGPVPEGAAPSRPQLAPAIRKGGGPPCCTTVGGC